jgi:LysR family glycine cleavage system transcriptional activator
LNRIGGMAFRLPDLKEKFGVPSGTNLLSRAPLIHVTSVSVDWNQWFRASGIEAPASIDSGLSVDTIQMGFDAAVHGLGVVLGRRPLVDGDIESGRLVPLARQTIPSGSGYWLVTSETEFQKPEVKLFLRWLLSELGAPTEHRKPAPPGSRTAQGRAR